MRPVPLIEASCRFEGLLSFRGDAHIDGEFEGQVVATGVLRLGESARVRGRIEVDELVVAGELEGDVEARQRVELLPSARVTGDLRAPRIALAEGSFLCGRCSTPSDGAAPDRRANGGGDPAPDASRNARLP